MCKVFLNAGLVLSLSMHTSMHKSALWFLVLLSQGALAQAPDPFDLHRQTGSLRDAAVASLAAARDHRPGIGALPAQPESVAVSPLALAIGRARKKGIIELGVEGYTEVLIECQKSRSVVLTTPLLRSDAQQDHCYRF